MTTTEIEQKLRREWLLCPECGETVHTIAAEGVPAQALRLGDCGHCFFMDMESVPQYGPNGGSVA